MAVPDSYIRKGTPPPVSPKKKIQQRRQRRLILGTLAAIVAGIAGWRGYLYMSSGAERAEALVQHGRTLLGPGHYPEAAQEFTKALAIDANSWNALFQRAIAEQNLRQLEPALADYQAALLLKPDILEARTASAAIYREKGDKQRALEELNKVIALKPSVDAYYQRGTTFAEMNRHQEAIKDFTQVIDDIKDAPYVFLARAKSRRALGDEPGAQEDEKMTQSLERNIQTNQSQTYQPPPATQ